MLRLFDNLFRFFRRHSPGGRERLAYRLLQTILIEAEPEPVPARIARRASSRGDERSGYGW